MTGLAQLPRPALVIPILLLAAEMAAASFVLRPSSGWLRTLPGTDDSILSQCPTLARIAATGQIGEMANPVFEDPQAARRFAQDCAKVVAELGRISPLSEEYAAIRKQAEFAAEFMTGDTYLLATSDVKSVVKLRESVKIPPPPGFVYVKKYASPVSAPPVVVQAFESAASSEGTVRGVTIQGRYIALIKTEYHDELVDNLAHEMVHAYLTLASKAGLPRWFQEGAAVYFSIGKDTRLYSKTGDPKITWMTIPEDYKRKLYSFQYIEEKVGREKLYEFVRRSVETGHVDARATLGLGPAKPPGKSRPPYIIVIPVGAIFLAAVIWLAIRQYRESFAD